MPYPLYLLLRSILVWGFLCLFSPFSSLASSKHKDILTAPTQIMIQTGQLLDRIFDFGDNLQPERIHISADIYLRHRMFTHRRGPIVRYIPGMLRLEPGSNEYQTEALLHVQSPPQGHAECKVVAFHSTARYLTADRLSRTPAFFPHLYSAQLFANQVLNPLHRRNKKFYRYACLFSQIQSSSKVVRLMITPLFANDQLTRGYVDVDEESGAILKFKFAYHYRLQRITVMGEMGNSGYEYLIPIRLRILSRFKLLGNRVNEVTDLTTRFNITCPTTLVADSTSRYDLTQQYIVRLDTTRIITSPSYFDSLRTTFFLLPRRNSIDLSIFDKWERLDSLNRRLLRNGEDLNDSLVLCPVESSNFTVSDKNVKLERAQNILLSSHSLPLSGNGRTSVKLPPIFTPSMFQWSKSRGISLRSSLRFTHYAKHSITDEPTFTFSPSLGYSFKQRQLYYRLPLNVNLLPSANGRVSLEAGGGTQAYNNNQAQDLRKKLEGIAHYDSLLAIIDSYGFHDYRDNYVRADFTFSPLPGLSLSFGPRYHRRVLIGWNELARAEGLDHFLSSIGPRLEVQYTPFLYYYRQGNRVKPLYSKWPTFLFCYERGYSLEGKESYYERIEGDIRLRIPLYAMRLLFFRLGGGLYTQHGMNSFIDYDYFRFNYIQPGWNDDLTGELQLLNNRWYNESRYYLQLTATYESPMLLLARAPFISRIIQSERFYCNTLSVRSLGFYTEVGYGIHTHLLDIGTFMGISPDRSLDFGCKLVLRFFDN